MQTLYYIGLDVHMSDCVKDTCDRVYGRRFSSSHRLRSGSMDENTSAAVDRGDGSHGVYRMDLPSFAATCCGTKVAHPLMLRAIAAEKNDRIDASKICDCLRCDSLPERPTTDIRLFCVSHDCIQKFGTDSSVLFSGGG